jgi:hypothetical protein
MSIPRPELGPESCAAPGPPRIFTRFPTQRRDQLGTIHVAVEASHYINIQDVLIILLWFGVNGLGCIPRVQVGAGLGNRDSNCLASGHGPTLASSAFSLRRIE